MSGDRQRLHQVVSSLLSNVRAHTPEGTMTRIDVSADHLMVRLSVTDDGPGIPRAALGRVFDRFYRADPSRSRRSGGSGLGLAIVEAIVTAHGGTATAANADEGGAQITLSFPKRS